MLVVGAKANKGAIVEYGKLKVRIGPHQTVGHLKGLISNATKGVRMPFELQDHSAMRSNAYDDDDPLSDVGLVSGSVVSVPVALLDIYFVLPQGMCSLLTTQISNMHASNKVKDDISKHIYGP